MIDYEDEVKLEFVKNYSSGELRTIIMFLEEGMFYDRFGRPYTREYFRNVVNRFGAKND